MESSKHKLIIAEYSEYPGPRYSVQGESSGEEFYHKILNKAFYDAYNEEEVLTVILDGTAGYASSFLDEAFGNLVYDFSLSVVKDYLHIISLEEPDWKEMIINESFVEWEKRRKQNSPPRKTSEHSAWFRLQDNELISNVWLQL